MRMEVEKVRNGKKGTWAKKGGLGERRTEATCSVSVWRQRGWGGDADRREGEAAKRGGAWSAQAVAPPLGQRESLAQAGHAGRAG